MVPIALPPRGSDGADDHGVDLTSVQKTVSKTLWPWRAEQWSSRTALLDSGGSKGGCLPQREFKQAKARSCREPTVRRSSFRGFGRLCHRLNLGTGTDIAPTRYAVPADERKGTGSGRPGWFMTACSLLWPYPMWTPELTDAVVPRPMRQKPNSLNNMTWTRERL